jgi:hypothetical protein
MFVKDGVATLSDIVGPGIEGKQMRGEATVFGFGDGCQVSFREEELTHTGAVFVGRSADAVVDRFDELL